jgi:hypothetical protein
MRLFASDELFVRFLWESAEHTVNRQGEEKPDALLWQLFKEHMELDQAACAPQPWSWSEILYWLILRMQGKVEDAKAHGGTRTGKRGRKKGGHHDERSAASRAASQRD